MKTVEKKKLSEYEARELDAWLAEHAMKWLRCASIDRLDHRDRFFFGSAGVYIKVKTGMAIEQWSPTTNAAKALDVLRACAFALEDSDNEETVSVGVDTPWMVVEKTNVYESLRTEADTLELAICLFAKKLFSK